MNYRKIAAAALSVIMLTSCSAGSATEKETDKPQEEQTQTAETESAAEKSCLSRISINTVNDGSKARNFATEPVNGFVSKSIASWTPGYKIPPEPYYEECLITVTDRDGKVSLESAEADVKVRGNWTTSYDKKPLRIKFKEKQSMAGLNEGNDFKNWVLLAEYKDGSMLRNKTALQISREIYGADGLYAADSELVEVYINDEYWGVYLLSELQQVNQNRVNISAVEKDYKGTDIGYFLEFDGTYENEEKLQQFVVDYADNAPLFSFNGEKSVKKIRCLPVNSDSDVKMIGMTIKSDINSQEQHDFIESYVCNVYRIMYNAAYENKAYVFNEDFTEITETSEITPQQAVEKVVDIGSLADTYIISELTCDADIYWSSFFMDADFGKGGSRKLRFEAPWDFDSSLGNKDRCADGTGFYAASIVPDVNSNEYETINPWLAVLMTQEWYRDVIAEKWTKIYDSGTFTRALDMIEHDKTEYRSAFERNYEKWQNLGLYTDFADELVHGSRICQSQEEAADYLSGWLNSRVKFLNDYWHR